MDPRFKKLFDELILEQEQRDLRSAFLIGCIKGAVLILGLLFLLWVGINSI